MISSILLASALGLAAAQSDATVTIESSDAQFNNKGISNIHFGAALNGALVSNESVPYKVNTTDNTLYTTITISGGEVVPMIFNELQNDLVASPTTENDAVVKDSYLTLNGSDSVFYACAKLAWDPYSYTGSGTYGVGVYASDAPSDCTPIKIKVTTGAAANTTTSSAAAATTGAAATTTVDTTQYTTISCPTPTTFTYGSNTFTVTESTVITVEDCGCTATGVPAPSVAATAAASTIPIANGAAAAKVGAVAGVAAAVAYML